MRRRDLITLLAGGAGLPWPLTGRAQQKAMPVNGYISGGSASFYTSILPAFRAGLGEHGYVEGENLTIEYRWAEGHYDRLPGFAAEFVSRKVDLIAATGGEPASRVASLVTGSSLLVDGGWTAW